MADERNGSDTELGSALPPEEEITGSIRLTEVRPVHPELVARDRATLTILTGPETGRVIHLDEPVVFGRSRSANVCVDDNSVSRVHARIVRRPGAHWDIEDLGSRNGTFVNGVAVRHQPLSDGDNIQLGATARFRFELRNVEEADVLQRMYESSVRDGLTGAFNRAHFNDRLSSELSFAIRHKTELALLMFDIDHFKRINDEYGHPAGDKVLTNLSAVVQHAIRAEDIFARYGGEEFAVIARGIELPGAIILGERLRGVAERIETQTATTPIRFTISVGLAVRSLLKEQSPAAMIAQADTCLYAAKHGGRNRVVGPTQ